MKTLWIVLLSLFWATNTLAQNKEVCILAFEREHHPIVRDLQDLQNSYRFILVTEAKPIDLLRCLENGAEEIVMILHSLQQNEEATQFNLGYFERIENEQRSQEITKATTKILEDLADLKNQSPLNRKKIKELESLLRRYQSLPEDEPIYWPPKIFYPRIFEKAYQLASEAYKNGELRLKKIRIMVCNPEKILKRIPALLSMGQDFGVAVETAPVSKIYKFFLGKETALYSRKWVLRSLQ